MISFALLPNGARERGAAADDGGERVGAVLRGAEEEMGTGVYLTPKLFLASLVYCSCAHLSTFIARSCIN